MRYLHVGDLHHFQVVDAYITLVAGKTISII